MEAKKKMLIVGGGHADIPLIQSGQKLGFHVITTGNRPEDLGHRYSDQYASADFSNPEEILNLAQSLEISAVCSSCNDFAALSAAYVAEKMNLPGHDSFEVSKVIHHKDLYREFATRIGIPTPKALGFSDERNAINSLSEFKFPIIIKPVDLTGGKGIARCDSHAEAETAIRSAFALSKAKRIVIEQFLIGSRHGFSALMVNQKIAFYFVDNEHYGQNPYMVLGASTPGKVPAEAIKDLIRQSEMIGKALSLKDGIFHIQFILHEGNPVIIEICRRPPGDLYIKFVQHATGYDYPTALVRLAAGLELINLQQPGNVNYISRMCIMTNRNGAIAGYELDQTLQSKVIDQFIWWKPGFIISDYLVNKLGIIFLRFENEKEMFDISEHLDQYVNIRYEAHQVNKTL